MKNNRISIVVPIFNEEKILAELTKRISSVVQQLPQLEWEVIYVDDGSSDGSPFVLEHLTLEHSWLQVLFLSRNFGHQTAVTAGMDHASGDAVILIDGDLQDPPELIPRLVEVWQEGFDVVTARRKRRNGESWFKLATAFLFYRTLRFVSDTPIPVDTGDFRLLARSVVEAIKRMPEHSRFVRGMVSWTGFRQTEVEYERDERPAGKTKYTLLKMLRLASNAILSFSRLPLQVIMFLGLFFLLCSFLGAIVVLYQAVLKSNVHVWGSVITAVLFLAGIQLVCLGAVASYVWRIFDEVRARPLYFIRQTLGNRVGYTAPIPFPKLNLNKPQHEYRSL